MPHGRSETAHQAVAISQEPRAVSAYQNRLTADVDPEQAFRRGTTFTLRDVRTSQAGAVQLTVTLDNNLDVMSYGGGYDGWSQDMDMERSVDGSFRRMAADILRTAGVHRGDSAEISMHDTTGVLAHDVFTGFHDYGQQGITAMAEALGDRIKAMSSYRDTPWSLGPHIKFFVTVVRGVHGGDVDGVSSKGVVIIRGHENCVGKAAFLGAMYNAYNDMRGYKTEEVLEAVGLNPGEDPIAWLSAAQRWEAHCRITGEARRTGEPRSQRRQEGVAEMPESGGRSGCRMVGDVRRRHRRTHVHRRSHGRPARSHGAGRHRQEPERRRARGSRPADRADAPLGLRRQLHLAARERGRIARRHHQSQADDRRQHQVF
ncbi:unnamed protein product [Phaeothamnion confervicola]